MENLKNAFLVSTDKMCLTQNTPNNTPRDCNLAVAKVNDWLLREKCEKCIFISEDVVCMAVGTRALNH